MGEPDEADYNWDRYGHHMNRSPKVELPTCEAKTQAGSIYNLQRTGGHVCGRKATYTDGRYFYCAQHAKVPPTPTRKAPGTIRPECRRITK